MLSLEKVSVSYGDEPVLHDISLHISAGEQVVLIGPSGAGKSTLLRKLYELAAEQAAFIHQDYALVPQLSAYHNVYAGRLDQHGVVDNLVNLVRPRQKDVAQVEPLLEELGLADKLFEPVGELSGGQQQRVAVARALYRGSGLVMGDEPVSAVDPHQSGTVLGLLKRRAQTLVLAMHDVQLALAYFNRLVGLRHGRIVFDQPADQVDEAVLHELYRPC